MAYTLGFLHDIYISYSSADDTSFFGFEGWLESFEEKLKVELSSRLGDAVSICRSQGVIEVPFVGQQNKTSITGSALFLGVVSPDDSQSDWRQRELKEFRSELKKGLFGGRGDQGRVFHVYIQRTNPLLLAETASFDFQPDVNIPLRPDFLSTPSFESRLNQLADAIEKILRSLNYDSVAPSPEKKSSPSPLVAQKPRSDLPTEAGLVFICHSHDDKTFAHDLANTLKMRGLGVWVDAWEITAGADWRSSVDKGLAKCDSLLIVLSPSSLDEKDENVPEALREVYMAMDMRKPIVPLLYQNCEIPPRLKLYHYIDFRSASLNDEDLMGQLLRGIRAAKK